MKGNSIRMKTKKTKVMIIDDEKVFLEELKETLKLSGYKTITFSDGTKALENVIKHKPDVILLDLKMEGKNGFQVADELRKKEETSGIPIIAMTGYYLTDSYEYIRKMYGLDECLIKPFNPLDVITKIELLGNKGKTKS